MLSLVKLIRKKIFWGITSLFIVLLAVIIVRHFNKAFDQPQKSSISGGVVPHHIMAKSIINEFFIYISSKAHPQTIVLLSPDHFHNVLLEDRISFITIDERAKKFSNISVDTALLKKLSAQSKIIFKSSYISLEHGIVNILPYVKKFFPDAKVLPVIIPFNATKEQIEKLMRTINSDNNNNTIVVASVDFSHYLPREMSEFHDIKSIATLMNYKETDFNKLEVDCWQCLYAARFYSMIANKEGTKIIAHKNSLDFLPSKQAEVYSQQGNTTSYFSVVFEQGQTETIKNSDGTTVLFIGDVMLDRGLKNLMKRNSFSYPFKKVQHYFRGVDIVFANLEGPIVRELKKKSGKNIIFGFSPDVLKTLSFGKVSIVSLANNHAYDMDPDGFEETRNFLNDNAIDFVGHPVNCAGNTVSVRDGIIFMAFNKIYPSKCRDEEIIKAVRLAREKSSKDFLIVSMHWGEEYTPKSSKQQKVLAHGIIDSGADLIIGHHPHVVQEVEAYNGRLIFYSLGNFVFDQYFSRETQEGIMVGLEIYPSILKYRIFPVKIPLSQPVLMDHKDKKESLTNLALKSDSLLVKQIASGIIHAKRYNH